MIRWPAGVLFAVVVASAGAARADEVDRCADRAEEAQHARIAGKLRKAREALIECSRDPCPVVVRRDCARWLSEVETELPSVVVRARDERGQDVSDVRVSVDGVVVAEHLDGRPVPVDVGERTFTFERAGASPLVRHIIVGSGERARVIHVDLGRPPTEERNERRERPSAVGPVVLGGVGLAFAATGGVLWAIGRGEHADLASTCAPEGLCATADIDAARTKLIVGDVAMTVGVLAVAGAVTWWLLRL